jgi:anaerobic dimethyl sulfoxide reductase subunit B (iron-sulfur subunit)
MRALEFGPLEDLIKKYGHLRRLDEMPKESITKPAAIFKPLDPKKRIIPWDANRALELWQKRNSESGEPLPDIFQKLSDITAAPQEIIGRNKLVLKATTSKALMYYTTDDE